MKNVKKKLHYWIFCSCLVITLLPLLLYAMYMAGFEYTFYQKYRTVNRIKLLHVYPWQADRFEIVLPVKFAPRMHDAQLCQKILVSAENKKSYIIYRFTDGNIQLQAAPMVRYLNIKYYHSAYYIITDPQAVKKLHKLLDAYRETEE